MFSTRMLRKIFLILLPTGIGLVTIGIIFLTDFKDAAIVARIKIETLIIGLAIFLSIISAALIYIKNKIIGVGLIVKNQQ